MAVVGKGSRTALANRTAQGLENVNFTLPDNALHIILGCGVGDDNSDRMRGPPDTPRFNRLEFKTGGDAWATVVSGSGAVRIGATDLVNQTAVVVGERLTALAEDDEVEEGHLVFLVLPPLIDSDGAFADGEARLREDDFGILREVPYDVDLVHGASRVNPGSRSV